MTFNSALLPGQTAQHRLTLELEAERARLLAAQAVARIGSWETDLASMSVAWSLELHRIFETDPDTFQPTHARFLERVHPDDRDGVADAFARSIGQPGTHTVEHRLLMPDGRVKFVEERWQAVSDNRGRPHRALGTCQDVTERREAAHALEALAQRTALRERMLSTMLSSISDFAYIFDRDGRFLYANQPLLDLWAIPLEEVLGKNFLDLVHPPDLAARLQGQVRGVIDTKESIRAETPFTSQGGVSGYYEYRFWPAFGADGRVDFVVGSARDVTERKRSDEAMRQAEEKYRSIFENSNDGIFQNQLDGRFIAANPALARMLGYDSPEELMRERTDLEQQSYVEPGLRAKFKCLLDDQTFINGFEYEVRRKDGSTIWISENVRVVRDAGGQPLRYEGSVQDITERRRTQEALRESEEGFRTLAEALPQIVWTTRPDGRAVHFNRRWMDYTGLTFDESLGEGWSASLHPDDRPRVLANWERAIDTGEAFEIDFRLRRADGVHHWMLGRALPLTDATGSIVKWFGTCTDIHDLKLAHHEITRVNRTLQRQGAELRALFDLMPAMIWFKDTDNGILRVNKRVADAAGRRVDEIEGKSSADIYPLDAAKYYADDLEVIRSGVPKLGIIETLTDQEGNAVWVQTDKVPYCDETGKVIGVVVMAQDISARKRSEAELLETHRELLEVSRSAGRAEVATNVLHNVGNVLNSVNVSANLLLESVRNSRSARMAEVVTLLGENKADLGRYITGDPKGSHIPAVLEQLSREWGAQQQVLVRELESLRGNIDHIKQIVAMQQGYAKVSAPPESVDVADVVEDTLRVKGPTLIGSDIQIIREFEKMPAIRVEKHKVLQILVNLVRNARLACVEQGDSSKRITIRTARVNDRVRIVVSDNGSGIAPENITRIFSHGFTTRKDGHGFGLHSGALAAADLGGSLSAHSEGPGKGATFTLDLPTQPPGARA